MDKKENAGEHIYMSATTRTLLYQLAEHLGLSKAGVIRTAIADLATRVLPKEEK